MNKTEVFAIIIILILGISFLSGQVVIEDFETGNVNLISYPGEDQQPDSWSMETDITYLDSEYSLKVFGNTWKVLEIDPMQLDAGSVWQVAAYVQNTGQYQGFGIMDDENTLLYSFAGTQMLDVEEWLHVYQGMYPDNTWNLFQLPVGDDWLSWFEYEPEITGIVFINSLPGTIYFDQIEDITGTLPVQPMVHISNNQLRSYRSSGNREFMEIQLNAYVYDPDCEDHDYYWEFGDGNSSNEQNPVHTYEITANHNYTVFLAVENSSGKWGFASTTVSPQQGDSDLPLKMNFVGDVMLARRYEFGGGIIPTLGVEAIFEPTRHLLGDISDITVVNLESPLTTAPATHPTKTINFKGHPDNVSGLVYAGVDIAMLANNHILDYMHPGLQQTQQVLEDAGIMHCGAGANSYEAYMPVFKTAKGINTAFIASSDRTGHYNNFQPYLQAGFDRPGFANMTPYYVQKQIDAVRDVSDLVVAMFHSGSEYSLGPISDYDYFRVNFNDDYYYREERNEDRLDIPKMWDREFRHFVIDAGADLIINHHPHIIHGLEVYNGKLIAHSLGNFAFDLNYSETLPTMVLQAEADETGFIGFSVDPVYIDSYIPQPATGQLGLYILDYLAYRSKELDTYLHIDREEVRAHVIMDTLSMVYQDTNSTGLIEFHQQNNVYLSQPLNLSRNGFISNIQQISPQGNYQYRLGSEMIWFGNFEDEGCTLWDTGADSSVQYDSNQSYEGQRSLRQAIAVGETTLNTNLRLRIRKYNNTPYTLHGYIKTQNATDVNVEIRYYTTRTTSNVLGTEELTDAIYGAQDWTFYSKELNVPYNAGYFDIVLTSSAPGLGTGYAWFDNIGLIEWSDWESYSWDNEIVNPNNYYYLQVQSSAEISYASIVYTERDYQSAHRSLDLEQISRVVPDPVTLHSNYPNPFNARTHFSFSLSQPGNVSLDVFNIKGQKVSRLIDEQVVSGLKTIVWEGKNDQGIDVASGVYFYQLRFNGNVVKTKKCLLLK